MRAEFINPFLEATQSVFSSMLSCDVTRGPLALCGANSANRYDVSGLIGLSGNCQGMVVVSFGRDTAISAAEIMIGERATDLNADVLDAVAEITNMIAGAAKAKLAEYQMSIGLPTVICGSQHSVRFPIASVPMELPFTSPIGPISLEIGLVEKSGTAGSR